MMSHPKSDQLRALAASLDFYTDVFDADEMVHAVGVELTVVGAEIMADGEFTDIHLSHDGTFYVITEYQHYHDQRRGGPLRRLAARVQRRE